VFTEGAGTARTVQKIIQLQFSRTRKTSRSPISDYRRLHWQFSTLKNDGPILKGG